jgi:hypothetical protein
MLVLETPIRIDMNGCSISIGIRWLPTLGTTPYCHTLQLQKTGVEKDYGLDL